MNSIILVGRLTQDPELRYMNNEDQTAYCFVTLAVNRKYDREKADFIRCKFFGKTAEILEQYTAKGSMIGVRGMWETGSYENKDGDTVYTNDCRVEELELMGKKEEDQEADRKDQKRKGNGKAGRR